MSLTGKFVNPIASGKYRNKLCVCGSGKKVKKCCGQDNSVSKSELDRINNLLKQYIAQQKALLK